MTGDKRPFLRGGKLEKGMRSSWWVEENGPRSWAIKGKPGVKRIKRWTDLWYDTISSQVVLSSSNPTSLTHIASLLLTGKSIQLFF